MKLESDRHLAPAKHEPQPRRTFSTQPSASVKALEKPSTREAKQPSASIKALEKSISKGRSSLLDFSKLKRQKGTDTCDSFNDKKHAEASNDKKQAEASNDKKHAEASKSTSFLLQPGLQGLQQFAKLKPSKSLQAFTELKSSWSSRTRTSRPRKESLIDRLFFSGSSIPVEHSAYIQTLRKLRDRERRTLSQVVSLNLMLAKLQQRGRPVSAVQELGWYDGRGMGDQMAPKIIAISPYAITSPAHKPKILLTSYFGAITTPNAIMAPPVRNPSSRRRPYAQTAIVVSVDDIACSLVVSAVAPKSLSPPHSRHSTSTQNSRHSTSTQNSRHSTLTQNSRPPSLISEQRYQVSFPLSPPSTPILPSDLTIPTTLGIKKDQEDNLLLMLKDHWRWKEGSVGTDRNMDMNFKDLKLMGPCLPMENGVMGEHGNSMVAV